MERAITKLKLHGFILNSHTNGEYMDDQKFWPILEAAEALGGAIYIHPRCPADDWARPYRDYGLYAAPWGFQAEVSIHVLRMMWAGVFDRFPKLKIVIGHMGESLPFNLWRLDYMHGTHLKWGEPRTQMKPSEILKRNFLITTSGVEDPVALRYSIEVLGADNVMWAIDYPYQAMAPSVAFMDAAPLSDEDKHKVFHGNAERVFHIPPAEARAAAE
jgi:2,3-dihydroxybenzoate decarboxylase/5-carboxyvanillate decarboxylase